MFGYNPDTMEVKHVKVLGPSALQALGIAHNPRVRGVMEFLLELCDTDLQIDISEMEVRALSDIISQVRKIAPFKSLHELAEIDPATAFFLTSMRQMTKEKGPDARRMAWNNVFRQYLAAHRHGDFPLTPWAGAIETIALEQVLLYCQITISNSRPKARQMVN